MTNTRNTRKRHKEHIKLLTKAIDKLDYQIALLKKTLEEIKK